MNNFNCYLEEKGISLSSKQLDQFEIYFKLLVEWNEKMNLTAITEKEEVYLKHFYDSITAAFYYDFTKITICDVGAGAGFPSIPIKICFPHLKVTIVDSLKKRITFLNHLSAKVRIKMMLHFVMIVLKIWKKRSVREAYDIVMARAVARMSVLSELCLPLVKVGGTFIAMKAAAANEEIENGKNALEVLRRRIKRNVYVPITI